MEAVELLGRLRSGRSAPVAEMEDCLRRIDAREAAVAAWAHLAADAALRRAWELEHEERACGPLFGLPVGVKDIFDTMDMPTAYGSAAYQGHRPDRDAALVARLRRLGAIIVGKTVTTEFAFSAPGPTRNPWNPAHTPGGSSSGSSAAVAAGMTPVTIGSQTGGSTIRPSAYCGIVGFKPTFGSLPTAGMHPLAPSMDTIGIHAGSVRDAAFLFRALTDAPPVAVVEKPLVARRIWFFPGPHREEADSSSVALLEDVAKRIARAGAAVLPLQDEMLDLGALSEHNRTIMAYEAASSLALAEARRPDGLADQTRELIAKGRRIVRQDYHLALDAARAAARRFDVVMSDFDAVLTFSAPGEAPPAEQGTGSSVFNRAWTTIGVPCITLPAGFGAHRLPLGVTLVGRRGCDSDLLDTALQVEKTINFPRFSEA
jgi:Asp-tRNA(Asn)/Glu-tRNA(Gln) amidotransferase A subunit family amidase